MPDQVQSLVFTASLAAVGWITTHLVDRVVSTPTIEYSISKTKDGNIQSFNLVLANITRDRSFEDINIVFQSDPCKSRNGKNLGGYVNCFSEINIIPEEPADDGLEPPNSYLTSAVLKIPKIMPGGVYNIHSRYNGNDKNITRVRLSSDKTTINFLKSGFETKIVRYEIFILIVFFIIWSLPFLYFTFKQSNEKTGPMENKESAVQTPHIPTEAKPSPPSPVAGRPPQALAHDSHSTSGVRRGS
jgi:hypothetical protein